MTAARSWREELLGGVVMAPREVPRARSVLALLERFAAGQGVAPSPRWLLDYDVVEAFCVRGCAGRASSTRGTYRSVLYQLAVPVHGAAGCRATPFAGAKAPPPYSIGDRADLAAIARAQRDPAKRSSALAMVVFGVGAGLRPGELAALRGSDVARRGGQVITHVTGCLLYT
jgi:integrase